MKSASFVAVLLATLCSNGDIHAVTTSTVSIGNLGNAADTRYIGTFHSSGIGAIAQPFDVGKTEVTNAQYVAFLYAVASRPIWPV